MTRLPPQPLTTLRQTPEPSPSRSAPAGGIDRVPVVAGACENHLVPTTGEPGRPRSLDRTGGCKRRITEQPYAWRTTGVLNRPRRVSALVQPCSMETSTAAIRRD